MVDLKSNIFLCPLADFLSTRTSREAGDQLGYDHTSLARYVREKRNIGVFSSEDTKNLVLIEVRILTPTKEKSK